MCVLEDWRSDKKFGQVSTTVESTCASVRMATSAEPLSTSRAMYANRELAFPYVRL